MRKYTFRVVQTDTYARTISVNAENEDEAKQKIEADMEDCPLETRSNTFQGSDVEMTPVSGHADEHIEDN